MSLVNDISGSLGLRTQAGGTSQQTTSGTGHARGAVATRVEGFGSVFQTAFNNNLATVFERGASGEFDDPAIAYQEQAAMQRLRLAQEAARAAQAHAVGGSPGSPAATDGADAAPEPGATTPGTVTGGGAAADATAAAVAEQREVYALRVRQSEARLQNISSSLNRDFPKAAQLVSASTGTWDPATFRPRTREEVEAFAQRMVIDATESAARLEIVKTQLDAARFEAEQTGAPAARQLVARLEADYARQQQYVDKLVRIVDAQSGGAMTDAGEQALAGRTLRAANDVPVAELAAELRASGMSEEQVARIIGANEVGVEQERTPGGSPRLQKIAVDMTASLLQRFNEVRAGFREEARKSELRSAEERKLLDKKYAERRDAQQAQAHRADQLRADSRAQTVQAQARRSAERDAQFQQWLNQAAARRA